MAKKRTKIFKCVLCEEYSGEIICKKCQKDYLSPKFYKNDGIISFYDYETIEGLIKYKYHKFGHRIFHILSKIALKPFEKTINEKFYLIPVDDNFDKGFSHTAVMAQNMRTDFLKPLFNSLRATSDVKYAGQSLEFRLQNPRNFLYTGPGGIDVILIDDITTTGLTLKEAKETLQKQGVNVALCVVFANLRK